MKKPAELREYLLASHPPLKQNPECLQVFIDAGKLQSHVQTSLHFEYQYTLNILVTDLAAHPNSVLVPMLAWLKHHQIDASSDAVRFEADILRKDLIDLSITVELTESVLVHQGENGYTTEHLPEPTPEYNLPDPALFNTLYAKDEDMTHG